MSNDDGGSEISIETEAECGSNPHLSDFEEPDLIEVTLAHSVISGYYDIPEEKKEIEFRRRSSVKKSDYISRRDLRKNRKPKNSTEGIQPELKGLLLELGKMNPSKPPLPTISPQEEANLARQRELMGDPKPALPPVKVESPDTRDFAVAGPSRPTRRIRMTPALTSKDVPQIPYATRNTYSPGRKGWRSIKEEQPKVVFVNPKGFEPPPRVADIYKIQRIPSTVAKKRWTGPSKIPVTSHALDKKEGVVDIQEGQDATRPTTTTTTYILKKSPALMDVQQHQPTPSKIPVKIHPQVSLTKKESNTNILQPQEPVGNISSSSSSSSFPDTLVPLLSDLELAPSKKRPIKEDIMIAIKSLSSLCPQKSLFPEDPNLVTYIYELIVKSSENTLLEGGGGDSPDLDFLYDDTDNHGNEIAELYSYTEQPELQLNVKAFEDQMELYELPPSWQRLSVEKRHSVVMKLLDQLECSKKPLRMRSARCILYIAQGCWAEMQSDTEQQHWARINTILLYQNGAFSAFTDLLNIEIENSSAAHVAMRKIAVSLADSQDIRVILSVLYTITEVIRNERATGNTEFKEEVDSFCFEIGNAYGDELLVIKLLGMVTKFCSGAAPHFPMKKVLLLLWKLLLVSLGGMTALKDMKAEKRKTTNLSPLDEDTMEIARTMRASSPPASASDLLEAQNQKRNTRPFRRSLMKQSSLDDQESLGMEMEASVGNDNGEDLPDMTEYDERRPSDNNETGQIYNNHNVIGYNRPLSPAPQHEILPRGLPWKPKVRQKDIDSFLDAARMKFVGYTLPGDTTTLFGLPEPIHEGLKILNEHVYTSLAELQIQKEEEIARNPMSTKEDEVELTPAEILYQAMLPNLPQYMIALLKILLAAAPTSRAKTDSINILADVLPEEMPMTVLQSMKLGIDVNRHKEIIVKAVSAILLLLLKHFKLNHVYQFEFMSQHLVFANCIPLVLKFFNQNIMAYVGAKNVIPILDFPACVIGDQPELTTESLEIGDAAPYSWRNMFSCINLLRILNKLTKWKHSRIMMLVVFKSAPILKRTLKVRHAMTQLYVLKLLKMQTKYLGRQWRKSNMKTISAIYGKVRHRLNDDWAYGNDLDARPWDFQAEECALRASVDRFNNRRYTLVNDSEFEPVDNCLSSVLGAKHELSDNFKKYYPLWLEQEVYGTPIEWERLLQEDTL